MSGIMFVISVPTEEYEHTLITNIGKSSASSLSSAPNDHLNRKIMATAPLMESGIHPLYGLEVKPMQKVLELILLQMDVENATWCRSSSKKYWQVTFTLESRDVCENLLKELKESRIGDRLNSVVSVIPCIYPHENSEDDTDDGCKVCTRHDHVSSKSTAWNRFVSSVRARLTVAQVVENIKTNAMLTFDFVCFLTIAIILCAIGLVENNTVYLISSMLLSPMMGPVIAGTFGTVIRDRKLQKMGVLNEIIGLGIAVFVGFLYGSVICIITDKYGEQDWPTYAMTSMGETRTLWVGCLIALLSGAAVALGVLSDNTTSIVGVAISTSLMPPAVNAGLLWSLATVYYWKGNETEKYASLSHTTYYSNNEGIELTILGGVSMCVTFTNIIFIYAAGILVFMIKEVAPITSRDQERRRFWKHDIKVARDYNRTLQNEEAVKFNKKFSKHSTADLHHSTDLSKNKSIEITKPYIYTWSPCMNRSTDHINQEFKDLFTKLKKDKPGYSKPLNFNFPDVKTQTRKLSQLFASYSSTVGETLANDGETETSPLLPNTNKNSTSRKKFIVTPCECDPLLVK